MYQDEEEKDDGEAKEISTPTHWSKLDPKTMKVTLKKIVFNLKSLNRGREWGQCFVFFQIRAIKNEVHWFCIFYIVFVYIKIK